jgi:hypothetical protein
MPKKPANKRSLDICLNGTDANPFHKWGLKQNPFPQTGKREEDRHCLHIQALGGDPIPDIDYIRRHLAGWSQELIDICCRRFVKGEYVRFTLFWNE